jgi:thioredoxin-related protein
MVRFGHILCLIENLEAIIRWPVSSAPGRVMMLYTLRVKWLLSCLLLMTFLGGLYLTVPHSIPTYGYLDRNANGELIGIDWSSSRCTLLVAVQPGCPYCTRSARFYKALLAATSTNSFRIVAVSSESVDATTAYIHSLGLDVQHVLEANFDDLRIQGTPTLLLVNNRGSIVSTWVGVLSAQGERDVFRTLRVARFPFS